MFRQRASNRGSMFEIATRISRLTSNFERYFIFKTAAAEKPASHMYKVAKGIKTRKAAFEITDTLREPQFKNLYKIDPFWISGYCCKKGQ